VVKLSTRAIHYSFSQNFSVSAPEAFDWCTNYSPNDMALIQEENARREVQRIAADTIILVDSYIDGQMSIEKRKLVCLYPNQLTWTATHLTGPNKYSQYLYEIKPETERTCSLRFAGHYLNHDIKQLGKEEVDELGRKLKEMDSENWKLLAKKMEKELSRK